MGILLKIEYMMYEVENNSTRNSFTFVCCTL